MRVALRPLPPLFRAAARAATRTIALQYRGLLRDPGQKGAFCLGTAEAGLNSDTSRPSG